MTILRSETDIRKIRESGKVVREILAYAGTIIRKGISTADLDHRIEQMIIERGAEPAFKGYKGYDDFVNKQYDRQIQKDKK